MKTPAFLLLLCAALSLGSPAFASSATANPGQSVVFSVAVSGTQPFSFQWMKDGAPIAGATGVTLTKTIVTAADSGTYTVRVSNVAGSVLSDTAVFNVAVAPYGATITITITTPTAIITIDAKGHTTIRQRFPAPSPWRRS
jgi:hypothetical protein